jgi:hypothetical protein
MHKNTLADLTSLKRADQRKILTYVSCAGMSKQHCIVAMLRKKQLSQHYSF